MLYISLERDKGKLSDKQILLQAFKQRESKQTTIVCNITGISYKIEAPMLPKIPGLCYQGLSPLASLASSLTLGKLSYSQGHSTLSTSVLAGAVLSLLHHYNIRKDKLSAVEANILLSSLPLYSLSQALSFLANLSQHECKRIPFLSLAENDSDTLKQWLISAHRALDTTIFEQQQAPTIKINKGKGILDQSVQVETRKQARVLLQNLKAENILPLKLQTIIQISIQKNNLALMGDQLRNNIVSALISLATPDCLSLAAIFKSTAANLTHQEAITKQQFDSNFESASDSFTTTKKPTLLEIIARKKAQATKAEAAPIPASIDYASMVKEIAEEVQEVEENSEDLASYETLSDDAILAEAEISELSFSDIAEG